MTGLLWELQQLSEGMCRQDCDSYPGAEGLEYALKYIAILHSYVTGGTLGEKNISSENVFYQDRQTVDKKYSNN